MRKGNWGRGKGCLGSNCRERKSSEGKKEGNSRNKLGRNKIKGKKKNNVLKLGLKISSISYISGPNEVFVKKKHILVLFLAYLLILLKRICAVDNEEPN